jgi:hypothetical protein
MEQDDWWFATSIAFTLFATGAAFVIFLPSG